MVLTSLITMSSGPRTKKSTRARPSHPKAAKAEAASCRTASVVSYDRSAGQLNSTPEVSKYLAAKS